MTKEEYKKVLERAISRAEKIREMFKGDQEMTAYFNGKIVAYEIALSWLEEVE